MATTPGGLPYPVGTDHVVDGDDAIRALAVAQEEFNKGFISAVGSVDSITGADALVVSLTLPPGAYDLLFSGTCDWAVSGTLRYYFAMYSGVTLLKGWQMSLPVASGTVPIAVSASATVAVSTFFQVFVRQTGVTGGQAAVSGAGLTARRIFAIGA